MIENEYLDCIWRILMCEEEEEMNIAVKKLEELDNTLMERDELSDIEFNHGKILDKILTSKDPVKNVDDVPLILDLFSRYDMQPSISDSIATFLKTNAKSLSYSDDALFNIITKIDTQTYIHSCANHCNLCVAIIEALSYMSLPLSGQDHLKLYIHFYASLEVIGVFLKKLCEVNSWKNKDGSDCTMSCLNALHTIITDVTRDEEPSPALIVVLELVNGSICANPEDWVLKVKNKTEIKDHFIKMICVLCSWCAKLSHDYKSVACKILSAFLDKMDPEEKALVAEIALPANIRNWLKMIAIIGEVSDLELCVLSGLLFAINSLTTFHKLCKEFGNFLIDEDMDFSGMEQHIEKLINVFNLLYQLFSAGQSHVVSQCQQCRYFINKRQHYHLTVSDRSQQRDELPDQSRYSRLRHSPSTSYITNVTYCRPVKNSADKVGLHNLGNTCYMNSVLQALVMTRQFCHEVLLYKSSNELSDQMVLKKLQNLFALLKYSQKTSLAPNEILQVSRPAYFMPGHQQDSSEFLCHLLDVLYEQEKSVLSHSNNTSDSQSVKSKEEDKQMEDIEEASGVEDSSPADEPMPIKRWTTEENLSEGSNLQRKTNSLADFSQGDLAHSQNLSDSHSDSTDSGIQSVGGEDSSAQAYLVHRVFGGEMKVTYQCMQCKTESHNTDKFRDLQLCFFEGLHKAVSVQELLNSYLEPEHLKDDNKYRCDKCTKLCEGRRWATILQSPAHLILTLKHFRYDSDTRLRTKLSYKVEYNETLKLPVTDKNSTETYNLYAAVVHSGYSMDYGHYFTYACDFKKNWYKFNDSFVTETRLEDFKRLEPPDTPYILFYKKNISPDAFEEDAPPMASLSKNLQDLLERENLGFTKDFTRSTSTMSYQHKRITKQKDSDSDDEDYDTKTETTNSTSYRNTNMMQ